jgi:hypothetical protein
MSSMCVGPCAHRYFLTYPLQFFIFQWEQFGPLLFNDTSGIVNKTIKSIIQEIQGIRNTSTFDVANWPNVRFPDHL